MPASEQAERLRAAGLKATRPRVAILDAVEQSCHHSGAEDIYRAGRVPPITLAFDCLRHVERVRRAAWFGTFRGDADSRRPQARMTMRSAGCAGRSSTRTRCFVPTPPSELPGGLAVLDVRVEYDVVCAKCKPTSI